MSEKQKLSAIARWAGRSKKERSAIGRSREPWNKGKRGYHYKNKRVYSEEGLEKIRLRGLRQRGKCYLSEEAKRRIARKVSRAMKGVPKSEDHRSNLSAAHNSKQGRKNHSKGMASAWADPIKRANLLAGMRSAWADPDKYLLRVGTISHKIAKRLRAISKHLPVGRPFGSKRKVLYEGVKGKIWMRCKNEVIYAYFLDKLKIDWLYEAFTFSQGVRRVRTWTPDFYLPKLKLFVELKGWLLPDIKIKIESVMRRYSATKFVMIRDGKDFRRVLHSKLPIPVR